jgi:hypothetical protein
VLGGAIAAIALSLVGGNDTNNVLPTPLGVGPRYHLAASPARVLRGDVVGRLRCTTAARPWAAAHVEVFAARRVLVVPAGIGMAGPLRRDGAYVVGARCSYPLRTIAPTGVVQVARGTHARLGDLFALWGQRLTRRRIAGFRGRVRAFVDGRAWHGRPAAIPLRRHSEIVVEVGGYVPPHRRFLFGPGQ